MTSPGANTPRVRCSTIDGSPIASSGTTVARAASRSFATTASESAVMRKPARGFFCSASERSTAATVSRRYARDAPTLSDTPSATRAAVSIILGRTAITSIGGGARAAPA